MNIYNFRLKKKSLLILTFTIITLVIIPNLIVNDQSSNEDLIDNRYSNYNIIEEPSKVSSIYYEDTIGDAFGVYVSWDYAYVANYLSLVVINISDPTNLGSPIYVDTTANALGVYVSGDYAYVANGESGLAIIDISDPTNPSEPEYMDTTGNAYDVYIVETMPMWQMGNQV